MQTSPSLSAPLKRIDILDSLRGFALLGVILIHMIQHFGMFSQPTGSGILQFEALDESTRWFSYNIIMGKFINIFAFLFGMSFFIQMDRAKKKSVPFKWRFVWRMILLLIMGLLSHSFFNIEILSVYAVFGLVLLFLNRLNNLVLFAIVVLLILGVPRIVQVVNHNQNLQVEQLLIEEQTETTIEESIPEHIANPSFLNTAKYNYSERLPGKLNYQFGYIGRGFITLALFIMGLIIGRLRFFERLETNQAICKKIFVYSLVSLSIISLIQHLLPSQNTRIFFRADGVYLSSALVLAQVLRDISMLIFTAVLVMGFIVLYQYDKCRKKLDVLAPYGRTALTNYMTQGIIGAIMFAPWAFRSYFGQWGMTALFLLGLIIYILQILLSKIWLKSYLYGPLEWLWRSGTYMKFQPYKKTI